MQKALIILGVGLLTVGCLTPEQKQQKALRDGVVGEYEYTYKNGDTIKWVLLGNGVSEHYVNGKKVLDGKWSIVNKEIHIIIDSRYIQVYRVNNNKSITWIAEIKDAKRNDTLNIYQYTYKNIN